MSQRWKLLFAALAVFAVVAAGCGSDDDDASDDTSSSESSDRESSDSGSTGGDSAAGAMRTTDDECADAGELDLPEDFNVVLVTDIGKVDDGTFNQYAFEGMEAAADCFGFSDATDFIETASEADYENNVATALSSDPEVIITVGFLLADATLVAANENPDVTFIGIDQFQEEYPENYTGVLFAEEEGGYMAGVLAASMSETGIIGVVAGREDVPPVVRFVNGYTAGAEATNPDIQVLTVYNEAFDDPAKGSADATQFMGEGADVIFGAGGPTGSGGVSTAAEAGTWAIGVDQDEYYTTFGGGSGAGVEYLLSSAMKRVDLGVFSNIVTAIDGSSTGGIYQLTAENLGITYAPFHDAAVTDEAAAALEAARAGLADGSVETGICGIDGLPLTEETACG